MITSVRFINEEETHVKVEPYGWVVAWPVLTHHKEKIDEFLQGGSPDEYDENHGKTLGQVIGRKKSRLREARESTSKTLSFQLSDTNTYEINTIDLPLISAIYNNAINRGLTLSDTVYWKMANKVIYPLNYILLGELVDALVWEELTLNNREYGKHTAIAACGSNKQCIRQVRWN